MDRKVAVVVPTIRQQCIKEWLQAWRPLLDEHDAWLYVVQDGETPTVGRRTTGGNVAVYGTASQLAPGDEDLFQNFTPACRQLGILAALRDEADIVITLDDDVLPFRDPVTGQDSIAGHLAVLGTRFPDSWFPTVVPEMRGIPYGIRNEREVHLSHGVWCGVPDMDAPRQLIDPRPRTFYHIGAVPSGKFTAISGMNVGFTARAAAFCYWAPVGRLAGCQRFDDIWGFLYAQEDLWTYEMGIASGYSIVEHRRASCPITNLEREARGIRLNEVLWKNLAEPPSDEPDVVEFFESFWRKRDRWDSLVRVLLAERAPPKHPGDPECSAS